MAISPIDPQIADLSTAISDQSCLQFQLLLFMSDDETRRAAATTFFDLCRYHHPALLSRRLAETVHLSPHSLVRAAAACYLSILLNRRDGGERYVLTKLEPNDREFVKMKLLDCVRRESNDAAYKQILCAVLELARSDSVDGEGWPCLFSFLIESVKNGGNTERVRALEIVGRLAEFGQCLVPHLRELGPGVVQCFRNGLGSDVRLTAFSTLIQILFFFRTDSGHDRGKGVLPLMVRTMVEGLCSGWEPSAVEMKRFVSLARYGPKLTSMGLVSVLGAMMQIGIATEYLEESTWFGAIEFIVALSETGVEFAKVMGNLHGFIHELLSILTGIISDVEDDPIWESADEVKAVSHDFRYCENCLFRLSVSLGGNTIVPVALELLPAYLDSPAWKRRHAAIICLSQVAQGQLMTNNLEKLLSMLLRSFCDPDPRLGCAAINAVVILFGYLEPDLKLPFHSLALPALVLAMADAQNPRLQASAASAVCQVCNNVEQNVLRPHLDDLVDKLCVLLQNAKQMVRMCALDALTSVADSSKALFQKHYDSVMPLLKAILVNVPEESNDVLRAKLLGCIVTVGVVAGKEKFKDDSKQVIEALTKLQESRLEADYPTRIILLSAWVRLRMYLGEDFLPYLPFVIHTVLQSAQLNLYSTIPSTDNSDNHDESSRTVSHEDKRKGIQISDSRLREKTFACGMLGYYADELKEAFFPWIDEVATVLVPLLRFDHEIVREAAYAAMPKLLRSAKLAIRKGQAEAHTRYSSLKQLTDQMVAALLNFLPKEPNVKIRLNKLETLRTCIQICASVLDEEQIGSIVEEMKRVFGTSTSVEDENLRENENEQEHGFLHQGKDVTVEERKLAICIWGDIVENCRNSVLRYYSMCLPFLLDACIDENQEVRQLAVYGLGLCAEYGGSVFRPAVREAVSRLTKVIGNPHTRHAESVLTNDYAVLVLGKICQFHHDNVDGNQVIPFWLDCLPIRGNVSKAKVVHEQLCSMVESFGEAIMGSNNQNLPKIVRVFVEVLHAKEDLATKQTASRMVNFLKQIQQTLLPSVLAALQPEQWRLLELVLSS